MTTRLIELDGAMGEGGGQILRTGLALSVLTGQPFRMIRIRAGRSQPGLRPQHQMSIRAAATISQADVTGDSVGSTEIVFRPGPVQPGSYHFAIGTAGATSLVLHTVYLPLLWRQSEPSQLVISGGTHVLAAPSFEFLDVTWRSYLDSMGMKVKLKMRRPGFYPRGGGVIEAHLTPTNAIRPLIVTGESSSEQPRRVTGSSVVAGLPKSIAERQARRAENRLRRAGLECELEIERWSGGPGTVVTLILPTRPAAAAFVALGQRGKPAERVADEAADQLLDHYHTRPDAVDPHSADQILMPLALADGPSRYEVSRVTRHLLTNIAVVRHFIDRKITCSGSEGEPGCVTLD